MVTIAFCDKSFVDKHFYPELVAFTKLGGRKYKEMDED